MFDTVNFRLTKYDVDGVDFLSETPCYFDVRGEHDFNGEKVITGNLKGLKVIVSNNAVKVKDGSLCKWYLGDNYQTMGRGDVQRAIEKLSDELHLPIDKATVTRMDIAQNFICQHPPEVYFNHLGALRYATRLQEPSGLYYSKTGGRLAFYDKNKEQKNDREPIPELYDGRNVLRYEQRYTTRIASRFKVIAVTSSMLYDESFYMILLNRWRDNYREITKVNDITLNFEAMKTKQELYRMGVLSMIEKVGGITAMLNQINEAQQRGELTRKQAYDLRQTVNDVTNIKAGLTVQSDAIQELNKKVEEAIKYYR